MSKFKRILVAVDGTTTSRRALQAAIGLAKEQGAALRVLHVIDDRAAPIFDPIGMPDYVNIMLAALRKSGRKILASAKRLAVDKGQSVQEKAVEAGGEGVAKAILAQAVSYRADLIVLGTHGRRGISRLVMGSDAEGVLREARVPVLLVRAPNAKPVGKAVRKSSTRKPAVDRRRAGIPIGQLAVQ